MTGRGAISTMIGAAALLAIGLAMAPLALKAVLDEADRQVLLKAARPTTQRAAQ